MILDKINPVKIFKSLQNNLEDLKKFKKYKEIVFELQTAGKLQEIGFSIDSNGNLYIGLNLNPELLMYSETSTESVELKMVSEKMKKYTDFLTKEGILDSVKVDYDRIKTDEYYGYILQVKYDFKKYRRSDLIYAIGYFSVILTSLISVILTLVLF